MRSIGTKLKGKEKFTKKRISLISLDEALQLKKPAWIRTTLPVAEKSAQVGRIKNILRKHSLHTVCEEASCPNLGECFAGGTATFMIMGDICTRRCPFCDVAHGRPMPLDINEPANIATVVAELGLRHVVITSVNRDDLKDGGASHFASCIAEIRKKLHNIVIEVLVPDFRKHSDLALQMLQKNQPDVVNHNLETVPSLYKEVRPGADYRHSLELLSAFREQFADKVRTKSGLMLGVGETMEDVIEVLCDMRSANVDMLTLGQYLQPSKYHLPVKRFVHPEEFKELHKIAVDMGFEHVASGPLVRSSYHADEQLQS